MTKLRNIKGHRSDCGQWEGVNDLLESVRWDVVDGRCWLLLRCTRNMALGMPLLYGRRMDQLWVGVPELTRNEQGRRLLWIVRNQGVWTRVLDIWPEDWRAGPGLGLFPKIFRPRGVVDRAAGSMLGLVGSEGPEGARADGIGVVARRDDGPTRMEEKSCLGGARIDHSEKRLGWGVNLWGSKIRNEFRC